jgi:murein tripeptide amidase MpaA
VKISSQFDGGNIHVVSATTPSDIQLRIEKDHQSEFYQWFYYRVQGVQATPLTMRLLNAEGAAYPGGWDDYNAVASYDRQHWFRVPTRYEKGELIIEHTPEHSVVYYAYFAPYSHEQHLDLIAKAQISPFVEVLDLGQTLDGRDLELLKVQANESAKLNVWITARQHPGETMAEWLVEGFLDRLLNPHDPISKALLDTCTFWIVPNMNPDGSVRGHLRTNAAGVNLNREWHAPSLERSPEVYAVTHQMKHTGVDLFLDMHGDETLPCNFIAGQDGSPFASEQTLADEAQFKADLARCTPDFQTKRGYPPGLFGDETLTIGSFWVGKTFECPSMTLEMPFKDHDLMPDALRGWSPERSKLLGHSLFSPLLDWTARALARD